MKSFGNKSLPQKAIGQRNGERNEDIMEVCSNSVTDNFYTHINA